MEKAHKVRTKKHSKCGQKYMEAVKRKLSADADRNTWKLPFKIGYISADKYLREFLSALVRLMKDERRVKKVAMKQDLVAKIQADRQLQTQELGWLFRPLALCPFPSKPLKSRVIINSKEVVLNDAIWQRKAGNLTISITADPRFGIPYGQDILIVLFLAIEARRQGSRKIVVNFYRDLMQMFGIEANSGYKYKAVQASMARIRNALYKWEIDQGANRETGGNYLYIEEWDLYFDPKNPQQRPLWDQYILLSERFWYEINKHKIPFNLEAARHLKTKPAHLNFYLWLSYRVWNVWNECPGEEVVIPYWGVNGLQNQMSSTIENRNDFRPEIRKWLTTAKEVWPRCPVEIQGDALTICVTGEDQLDVQPMDTDAPRILPRPKPGTLPETSSSSCPNCGQKRTLKKGKQSRQGYRMPDYWHCAGGCKPVSAEAICPECGQVMIEKNKGRADYFYQCECGVVKGGEDFWLTTVFK